MEKMKIINNPDENSLEFLVDYSENELSISN